MNAFALLCPDLSSRMLPSHALAPLVLGAALALTGACTAQAQTTVVYSADFESPTYHTGDAANQGGWYGWNSIIGPGGGLVTPQITTDQAFSGTQSMHTTSDSRAFQVDLAPELPYTRFDLTTASAWWVRAYVYVLPGASPWIGLFNPLGTCPLLMVGADTVPYANDCRQQTTTEPALGSSLYNRWVEMTMTHAAGTNAVDFSLVGAGLSWQHTLMDYIGGPAGGQGFYLGVSGDVYWDDIAAGYGAVPVSSMTPEPSELALMGIGLGALGWRRRRGAAAGS